MKPPDDVMNFLDLPRLLGTDLYNELFDEQSVSSQSDIQESYYYNSNSNNNDQYFHEHPSPPLYTDLDPESPPTDVQRNHALPSCPLDTDAHAAPVLFHCDCGEAFDALDAVIAHRETVPQHKPWHGVWEAHGDGVCLCGRVFDDEHAVRRHAKMADARASRWECDGRRIQVPGRPRQRRYTAVANREAMLQRHIRDIDMLIVEGMVQQLVKEKDGMPKQRMSQKKRKEMEREKKKASTLASHSQGVKL